jgi:hypothetical protein
MGAKRIISKVVGVIQTTIGGIAILFAFSVFYNIFNIQTVLGFTANTIVLYIWIFIIFGLLSIISGLFLSYET